jgi:uncharacterized protein YbaP (TraB family)
MKKILGLLLVCWAFNGWAQNSLLFEIKSPNSDRTSYLFGTLHMADNKAFQWNDSVLWAIDQTEKALFELDLDTKKLSRQSGDIKKMMKEWEIYFKKEIAPEVEQLIDADTLAVRAVSVYSQVLDLAMKMRDTDRSDFVDQFLQDYARKKGKEIVGIETAEEQLEALTSVDKEELKKAIIKFVKKDDWDIDLSAMLGDQNMLIDAYAKLSLDEVCEMMDDVVNGSSNTMVNDLYERLLVTRNGIMYDRVKDLVANESVFIGVGAGHLCGKTGLVQRFEKAGYMVRPVDISTSIHPLQSWTTFTHDSFSVDVPSDISDFYRVRETPDFGAYNALSSREKATWYTHRGKIEFRIERILEVDDTGGSNTQYNDRGIDVMEMEALEMFSHEMNVESLEEEEPVPMYEEEVVQEEVEVEMIDTPVDVEVEVETEVDEIMVEMDIDSSEWTPITDDIEIEEVIVETDDDEPFDNPPAVEYSESMSEGKSMNRGEEVDESPRNEEYWDRFGKRMKKEMMTVMFSGFGGLGAKNDDDEVEPDPVYVEVLGEQRKLIVNTISNSRMSYLLEIEHEGTVYELKLKGDKTAFDDESVLRFFTSFKPN